PMGHRAKAIALRFIPARAGNALRCDAGIRPGPVHPRARGERRCAFVPFFDERGSSPRGRAANSLLLLPPFPPAAERCTFTCVESIICVSVDRPFPASSRNKLSQTPRRAQRTKRL